LANTQYNQVLVQPLNTVMEDVVVTTDEKTLNTLDILKITKDMNEKCTICLYDMNEDEEYFDIECKHIFHKDCLETYLKNYNHICPVCRNEIGESNPNINSHNS
jgi:E3 ubiquitin-protein ligase RHA2